MRTRLATLFIIFAVLGLTPSLADVNAERPHLELLRDRQAAADRLVPPPPSSAHSGIAQPDTQVEPSISVNPHNPLNAVASFQEGRFSDGGAEALGFATTFDGGKTWRYGEIPGLTYLTNGVWDRVSDAVVAFGPNDVVYVSSLLFDFDSGVDACGSSETVRKALGDASIGISESRDGGRTWSSTPALIATMCGALEDKEWLAVDNAFAPGHHPGRVYAVWNDLPGGIVGLIAYSYCDGACDQAANWIPNAPLPVGPEAYIPSPVVLKDGSFGMAYIDATGVAALPGNAPELNTNPCLLGLAPGTIGPPPAGPDLISMLPVTNGACELQFVLAPHAGQVPFPAPLTFTNSFPIAKQGSVGARYQRAAGLISADADQLTGRIYVAWEDSRLRTEPNGPFVNDAMLSYSDNMGMTWSNVIRINPGPTDDFVNRYNTSVAAGGDGTVRIMYRQRKEAFQRKDFSPFIDTYFQESFDGGQTFSPPLKVNRKRTVFSYGAFSRAGLFQGDYDQIAAAGPNSYIVREEAFPKFPHEPPGLKYNSEKDNYIGDPGRCAPLRSACFTHNHQRTFIAVVGPR